METKERAHLAAKRYLEIIGCHVIYTDFLDRFIVMEDEDGVALVDVFYTFDGMSTKFPTIKREVFEDAAYKFFAQEHEPIDVPVRYDTVELFIMNEDRAFIRYHVKARLED